MQHSLCPKVNNAFKLLGQKWNGLLIQFLLSGPSRFTHIEEGVGISARLLCERLKELEKAGIVLRKIEHSNIIKYELSEKGKAMQAIIESVENWAEKYN